MEVIRNRNPTRLGNVNHITDWGVSKMAIFEPQKRRLSELLDSIDEGEIQLPEFQRSYVWNRGRRYHLLDSMQKNFPVGTLLLLQLSANSAAKAFKFRLISGVDELGPAAKVEPTELILDGQQRLTSLYRAFSRNSPEWTCLDVKALFERVGLQENQDIDFEEFLRHHKQMASSEHLLFTKHLLPLHLVMPSKRERPLAEKLIEYRDYLIDHGDEAVAEFVLKVLPSYLGSFANYELPVVSLSKGLTISAIAGIFTELNNTGQKLTAFDLCVAKFYASGLSLRNLLDESTQTIDHFNWLDPDGTTTLQYLALHKNAKEAGYVSSKKSKLVDSLDAETVDSNWKSASIAIGKFGGYIQEIGFGSKKTLPYEAVIPGLSFAISSISPKQAKPAEIRNALTRFIIGTGLNQRYTEGTDSKREADVDDFFRLVTEGQTPDHLSQSINTALLVSTGLAGARFKTFLGLLNSESPKDFLTNQPLGLDAPDRAQAEIHHIFPKSHMEKVSSKRIQKEKRWEVALNALLLTPETNKWVSNDPPSTYLKRSIDHLVSNENLNEKAAKARVKAVLEMQFIDDEAYRCLQKDDFDGFVVARAKALALKLQMLGLDAQFIDVSEGSEVDVD